MEIRPLRNLGAKAWILHPNCKSTQVRWHKPRSSWQSSTSKQQSHCHTSPCYAVNVSHQAQCWPSSTHCDASPYVVNVSLQAQLTQQYTLWHVTAMLSMCHLRHSADTAVHTVTCHCYVVNVSLQAQLTQQYTLWHVTAMLSMCHLSHSADTAVHTVTCHCYAVNVSPQPQCWHSSTHCDVSLLYYQCVTSATVLTQQYTLWCVIVILSMCHLSHSADTAVHIVTRHCYIINVSPQPQCRHSSTHSDTEQDNIKVLPWRWARWLCVIPITGFVKVLLNTTQFNMWYHFSFFYPSLLLSRMFEHDCLDICCFGRFYACVLYFFLFALVQHNWACFPWKCVLEICSLLSVTDLNQSWPQHNINATVYEGQWDCQSTDFHHYHFNMWYQLVGSIAVLSSLSLQHVISTGWLHCSTFITITSTCDINWLAPLQYFHHYHFNMWYQLAGSNAVLSSLSLQHVISTGWLQCSTFITITSTCDINWLAPMQYFHHYHFNMWYQLAGSIEVLTIPAGDASHCLWC